MDLDLKGKRAKFAGGTRDGLAIGAMTARVPY
jgi:hypothetical protein